MEHPHTHPLRPDQGRSETAPDVLDIALQLRNMLSNEEIWYILTKWKEKIQDDTMERMLGEQ